jgi:CDP-glycerol glycerophosphotransferase
MFAGSPLNRQLESVLRISIDEGLLHFVLKRCIRLEDNRDWAKSKGGLLSKFDKAVRLVAISLLRRATKIEDGNITMVTTRDAYCCNPKYVVEYLNEANEHFNLFWSFPNTSVRERNSFPDNVNVVPGFSFDFYKAISSSRVIIDNSIESLIMGYRKKEGQFSIVMWHGSYGLKRFDRGVDPKWVSLGHKFGSETDVCFSNSAYETEIMKGSFFPHTNIIECGKPVNDILFKHGEPDFKNKVKQIRADLGIEDGTKIALFAPTYRYGSNTLQVLDFEKVRDSLTKRFDGKWLILYRAHYETIKHGYDAELLDCVLDVSSIDDITELMMIADVGITDYSSWICNYILLDRPCFLYTPDLQDFERTKGFYHPLDETPFLISCSTEELCSEIENYNSKEQSISMKDYLRKVGFVYNPNSSRNVVTLIREKCGTGKQRSGCVLPTQIAV